MHVRSLMIASIIVVATAALAQNDAGATSHNPSVASTIRKIDGVHKSRFANSTVQQEKFQSEDILEIVPYGSDAIYFRVHLEFYNGHLCDLQGIAKYKDGAFLYHGPPDSGPDICTLTITPGNKDITLDDIGGNCRAATCGARGGYHGVGFARSSRRTIRYMKRLLASKEYAAAVAELDKSSSH